MTLLHFILPLIYAAYALSPFCAQETKNRAQKSLYRAWYPRESRNGNNPASQYVHEVGGYRFFVLLTVPFQLATGAVFCWLGYTPDYSMLAQPAVAIGIWFLALRWIDLGEHAAEVMHAERAGIAGYRDAEAVRMTAPGQDYDKMTPSQFKSAMAGAAWRAKIILKLGRW